MVGSSTSNTEVIAPSEFTPLHQSAPKTPAPGRPGRYLVYAGIALAALTFTFLLTARSVTIVVDTTTPARVSVSGLALPLGQRYLLRPGDYEIHVTAPGYKPLDTVLTVAQQDNQTVTFSLQPLPGRLSIDSIPQGADVALDGKIVGTTPLRDLLLEQGEYQLQLQNLRYLPLQQTVQIVGRDVPQHLDLQLQPGWAKVSVDSEPQGAIILLDGESVGVTPKNFEVLRGEHQLLLQLASFADWHQTLQILAGADQDLGIIKMQPASGTLNLSSVPAGANVTLDGNFQGQTPITLQFAPDIEHRLAVFKPGYKRYRSTLQLPSGGSDQRMVKLQAQLGDVRFQISPPAAVLYINGKRMGSGSQTLSLPATAHAIEVSLDGHASVQRRITPRPGLAQLVEVSLQTEQQARMRNIAAEVTTPLGQTLRLFRPAQSSLADFTMGASRREPGRRANEVLHPVALRRMFYLQTTEVTNAQFREFQPSHNSGQVAGNSLNQEQQPVVRVSWQQAAAFCNWLSAKQGLRPFYQEKNGIIVGFNPEATGYRLPSEAEWAWAARTKGGTLLRFPWGDTFPPKQKIENYADNASAYVTGRILTGYEDGYRVSAPVASFVPNQHGLYDMGGNVAEWVNNVYSIARANGATQTDPLGSKTGDNYVIRGASWTQSKLSELRLSYRDYGQAGRDDVGFRIARYAE